MNWLVGNWTHLGAVAGKAALMYAIAVAGLRIGERRTLAQWRIIDFAVAVAIGAVIGRTATASTQSFITGAVALIALLTAHRVASLLRLTRPMRPLLDHRVRVLIHDGALCRSQLRRCGLTDDDVSAHLRQQGVGDLNEVKYLIYEASGNVTVVRHGDSGTPLVREALDGAAPFRS